MRPCVFRSRGARRGQRAARRIEVAPTLRAMPDGMPAMQIPTDGHPEPRTASAPGLLGDLEHDVVEHDDIVPAGGALFDVAEDRVEISAVKRDKGRGGAGRRGWQVRVVVGDEAVEE